MNKNITIEDIRNSLWNANLDTEYREALANSMILLGYVSDSPLRLSFGTEKQREEIERVETMPLNSNQLSELIHLMMHQMRDDFQYGSFKPVAEKYINISKQMESKNLKGNIVNREFQKPICNIYGAVVVPEILGLVSKTLKQNNMFDESKEMIERATLSYSYDEALDIIGEYVEVVEEREEKEEFE